MSTTQSCPACGGATPAEYNFCVVCNKQIRCLNDECRSLLLSDQPLCLMCGQRVAFLSAQQAPANRYVRDVTQRGQNYEEHIEFSVSDRAVSELAPFIVGQALVGIAQRRDSPIRVNGARGRGTESEGLALPSAPAPSGDGSQTSEGGPVDCAPTLRDVTRFFVVQGEHLAAREKDFRGKSWAEQQRNFVLLYVWAHKQLTSKLVPSRTHLREAATRASVIDVSNFTRYLTNLVRETLLESDEGLDLNNRGEKEVDTILGLMVDEKATPGYRYWDRNPNSIVKKSRLGAQEISKVEEWAHEDVPLGSLNIRSITKARDYALVALWAITIHLKMAKSVLWNEAYHFLEKKYGTVSASRDAFSRAMSKAANRSYIRVTGESYFLSQEGEKLVASWVSGASAPADDGKKSK